MKPSIAQMIAEQRQCLSEIATLAAKGGKGQSLAQHRQQLQSAILDVLVWCQENGELVRAVKAQKGEKE